MQRDPTVPSASGPRASGPQLLPSSVDASELCGQAWQDNEVTVKTETAQLTTQWGKQISHH